MNKHYYIVCAAFLLAQFLMTSVMVYDYQKKKDISWYNAMRAYITAEFGYFVIGAIGIACVCFILSDFIDLALTKKDLISMEHRGWKENLQLYFKTGSFVISSFIQYIVFKYRDKGKVAIDNAVNKMVP